MSKLNYDQIIVTGCSFSCGMEMNDHLLHPFTKPKERQLQIWKWAKTTLKLKIDSIHHLNQIAKENWERKERVVSWPAFLQTKTGIPVTNLADIGSSIGGTLVRYSDFIRQKADIKKKILAIHQLPYFARMYMRFNATQGRINVCPSHVNSGSSFGFDRSYYKDDINKIHQLYKKRIAKIGYLERYVSRILLRLEKVSSDNQIKNYYILPEKNTNVDLPSQKILIHDFENFRSNYSKGVLGHPTGSTFNADLCDIITSTCF